MLKQKQRKKRIKLKKHLSIKPYIYFIVMKVYCKLDGFYHIYDGVETKKVFEEPKGDTLLNDSFYDENKTLDECLKAYYDQMKIWTEEIVNGLKIKSLNKCFDSESKLLYTLFKIYRKDKHIEYDPVSYDENCWFDNCNKTGLIYADVGEYKNVNAYDFQKFYSNILGHYNSQKKFPIKAGQEIHIKEFPENKKDLQYGIYRVKIISKDENITRIFGFSKADHYTHEDIQYAFFLKSKGYIDSIDLINDGCYNALVYNEFVDSKTIFKTYVGVMNNLAIDYPKNKLIKALLSSLWGRLWVKNTVKKMTQEEFMELDEEEQEDFMMVKWYYEYDKIYSKRTRVIEFVKSKSIYKYNIRLQPFLGSFARKKMGNQILKYYDDIIRVQVDGVIFKNTKETLNLQKGLYIIDKKYNDKNIFIKNLKKVIIR